MKRYMLLVFGAFAVLTGCTPTLPPATAGGGFSFLTTMLINGHYSLAPRITLEADFVSDFDYTAAGNPATIRGQTDVEALLAVPNGRAPANWKVYWINGGDPACPVAFHNGSTVAIGLHRVEQVTCSITNNALSMSDSVLTIAPGTIATLAAPSTVTVYGQGFSSQYGMPLMQYYDIYGTLVGQTTASYVAGDGSYVQGPTPDLSQAMTGAYAGIGQNFNADGSLSPVGAGNVDLIAPPGYMAFRQYADGGCGKFDHFVFRDAYGNVNSYPLVLTVPGCQGTTGGTVYDSFGHQITIYLAGGTVNATLYANGTQYTLPMAYVWN